MIEFRKTCRLSLVDVCFVVGFWILMRNDNESGLMKSPLATVVIA
ncbi:hypothetical protein HanPI659440_Chr10g0385121 [Helianthus annuus]|nr:hypothetical protein HanPI659440_Chr10g0385121 [Helianthus annuus]